MASIAERYQQASFNQAVGVAAQILFAAPALIASLAVARLAHLSLVADLALTFGATSTIMSAASFNLTQHLALWGLKGFTADVFWLNRVVASFLGVLVAIALLLFLGADPHLIFLAAAIKFADNIADLGFGLNLLRVSSDAAMQRLFVWSAMRIVVFIGATAVARRLGFSISQSLVGGGIAQLTLLLPWRTASRTMVTLDHFRSAIKLGRSAWFLSVATTACGLLVTTPRMLAHKMTSGTELGYLGVVFVASTLIGMSFNVAWLRLASASRTSDPVAAIRAYLREGALLSVVLVAGMWLSRPLIARVYKIGGPGFGRVLMVTGGAFVLLYFVMTLANLLKNSSFRLMETTSYLCAAAALTATTVASGSLAFGIVAAAVVLAVFVIAGVHNVRRIAAE